LWSRSFYILDGFEEDLRDDVVVGVEGLDRGACVEAEQVNLVVDPGDSE